MEYLNWVNEDGSLVGKIEREDAHNGRNKSVHSVIHLYIVNSEKKILMQKRSMNKSVQPGKWDTSVGGHIVYKDTPVETMIKEANEELGIKIRTCCSNYVIYTGDKYFHDFHTEREFIYCSFMEKDIDIKNMRLPFDEVDEVKYMSIKEIDKLIKEGKVTDSFALDFPSLIEWIYRDKSQVNAKFYKWSFENIIKDDYSVRDPNMRNMIKMFEEDTGEKITDEL